MRLRRKTIIGKINAKGELSASWQVLGDLCKMHPNRGVIIRAEILATEPSERTKGYWWAYIIPELREILWQNYGERYTKEQTYDWLRNLCPLFIQEERVEGKWKRTLKEFEELDSAEAGEAIDWVMQYVAENFNEILDEPK